MKIDMNIKANLTSEDVLQIVQAHLENEGYIVSNIIPEVGTREVGHQMNSHTEAYFKGIEADIRVKPIKPKKKYKHEYIDFNEK